MRIMILGRGPLAEPLSRLAERAGHSVSWVQDAEKPSEEKASPDMLILAGSSTAVEGMLESVARSLTNEVVIVDASIPTQDERGGQPKPAESGITSITATLPRARIVRAFASVPAEALVTIVSRPAAEQGGRLAVPLAGNDLQAKIIVEKFMREIGVDPFDVGALSNVDVVNPGGALWGKALNPVEMLEAVGWLSGDG